MYRPLMLNRFFLNVPFLFLTGFSSTSLTDLFIGLFFEVYNENLPACVTGRMVKETCSTLADSEQAVPIREEVSSSI